MAGQAKQTSEVSKNRTNCDGEWSHLHKAILISIILCLPCHQRRYSCFGRNTAVWKPWAWACDWGKTPLLRSPCGILHWSYWISTFFSGKVIHWRRKTHYPKYFKVPEEVYLTCLPFMWTHSVSLWAIFTGYYDDSACLSETNDISSIQKNLKCLVYLFTADIFNLMKNTN